MIEYRTELAVDVERLEHLANDEGWVLKHVLHAAFCDGHWCMHVLLSKTSPDNLSGLMIDVDKPRTAAPRRRGRPPKNKEAS